MNQTVAKTLYVAGVTTFCTFLACWAMLAHQENTQQGMSRQTRMADEEFAKKAAQANMAEVKLGQLAEEKAQNEEVKKFARRMVEGHTQAFDKLKEEAMIANINLPTDLNPRDEAKYKSLSKLSGPEFHKAYAKEMVKDHEQDVGEFRREAISGKKDPIKKYAAETLPVLQSNLKQAREMEQAALRKGTEESKRSPDARQHR
jgi:predicted outer membrane protein